MHCPHCGTDFESPTDVDVRFETTADYPPHAVVAVWRLVDGKPDFTSPAVHCCGSQVRS